MYRRGRAFTLAELVTVLAIVGVLAGLLFPVFLSAKSSAKRTQCVSNMHQAWLATELYLSDYDEIFMPVNHRPALPPNARYDRTWVQLVLPYTGTGHGLPSFAIFTCPADTSVREVPDTAFDQDLVPGDIYAQSYMASMHVNMGYNYLYLAPIMYKHGQWISEPTSLMSVAEPSKTLLFVDSLWDRLPNGAPAGGGSWLVVPPCRYADVAGSRVDTFNGQVFAPFYGWTISQVKSPHLYGNAWPWHNGRVNLVRVDGSVTSVPVSKLSAGCSVKDQWGGVIDDPSQYIWSSR